MASARPSHHLPLSPYDLPTAGRITGIGLASAVFIYYLVKLLVKPFVDVRLADNAHREFALNAVTGTSYLSPFK